MGNCASCSSAYCNRLRNHRRHQLRQQASTAMNQRMDAPIPISTQLTCINQQMMEPQRQHETITDSSQKPSAAPDSVHLSSLTQPTQLATATSAALNASPHRPLITVTMATSGLSNQAGPLSSILNTLSSSTTITTSYGGAAGVDAGSLSGYMPPTGKNKRLKKDLFMVSSDRYLFKLDKRLTQRQLAAKREEFWDTAPAFEGKPEIWAALKAAVDACESQNFQLAQCIIDSASIM